MKKIKDIFLLFLAGLLFTYFILFTSFHNLQRGNIVDRNTRTFFLKSKITRALFMLNEWGDGRFEYLSEGKGTIFVEVDYQLDRFPEIDLESVTKEMVYKLTGKNAEVKFTQDPKIADLNNFTDKHIKEVLKDTKNYKATDEKDYLHIIYLSKSREEPTHSGWVVGSDEIIIFKDTINELSENPEIISRIEESTIKHEFGHLLGLDHVERENCIMSESVEVHGNNKYQKENIPTSYCAESLVVIDKYKEVL